PGRSHGQVAGSQRGSETQVGDRRGGRGAGRDPGACRAHGVRRGPRRARAGPSVARPPSTAGVPTGHLHSLARSARSLSARLPRLGRTSHETLTNQEMTMNETFVTLTGWLGGDVTVREDGGVAVSPLPGATHPLTH